MSMLVADCPRCKAKSITFELRDTIPTAVHYNWQQWYEAFCICRACHTSTVFILSQKHIEQSDLLKRNPLHGFDYAVNEVVDVVSHISLKDTASASPPEHLPPNIEEAFREGAACVSISAYNAAATMFRLCIDLSTRSMLPTDNQDGLNNQIRRSLGLRLNWLLDHKVLPEALRDLSTCIKDDGNDGAHEGTLHKEDVEDLLEFCHVLIERIYTEPKRIQIAKERRDARRQRDDIKTE
jgi:uncharacterized protein DUF4145